MNSTFVSVHYVPRWTALCKTRTQFILFLKHAVVDGNWDQQRKKQKGVSERDFEIIFRRQNRRQEVGNVVDFVQTQKKMNDVRRILITG